MLSSFTIEIYIILLIISGSKSSNKLSWSSEDDEKLKNLVREHGCDKFEIISKFFVVSFK